MLTRAAIIVLAGVLTYWNSTSGPLIVDDIESITTNDQIKQLWPPSVVLFPARELPTAGRPLVNLSFAVNYALGGLDVRGYHLVNIALHIACGLLLFDVVRRTLLLPSLRARFAAGASNLAFAASLLWLVHPLQSEAVNYLTQRTELMMALFYLLTLSASIRAHERPSWQSAACVLCVLGMGCKESMATVPLMIVLYDRIFVFRSLAEAWRARWRFYLGLAASWLILIALMWSGPRSRSTGFSTGFSPWIDLLNQTMVIAHYLWLVVWPHDLVAMYGVPRDLTLLDVLPQAAVVAGLAVAVIGALKFRPTIGFMGAWFFVTLAPTSSIVPIVTEVGAERRMYLPLAAVAVFVVIAALMLWRHLRFTGSEKLGMSAVVLLAIALSAATIARNRDYASALSLARTVTDRWPNPRAQTWLGVELLAAGQHDEGLAAVRAALEGDPKAHYPLARTLYEDGKLDEAIEHYRAYIAAEPLRIEVPTSHQMIGQALMTQGKPAEAVREFRTALWMDPSNSALSGQIADALMKQEKFNEAAAQYQIFLRANPRNVDGWMNQGVAFVSADRIEEAIVAFSRAVELDGGRAGARRNLARALTSRRRFAEALPHAMQAVALAPNDAIAHDELGLALAGENRRAEAQREFQRAFELDPNDGEIRAHLAAVSRSKDGIIPHP